MPWQDPLIIPHMSNEGNNMAWRYRGTVDTNIKLHRWPAVVVCSSSQDYYIYSLFLNELASPFQLPPLIVPTFVQPLLYKATTLAPRRMPTVLSNDKSNDPNNHYSEKEHVPSIDKHSTTTTISDKLREKMSSLSRSSTSSSSGSFDMKNVRASVDSIRSAPKPASTSSPKASKPKPRPQSTTFSDCGRHSNKWLFNDFSVSDSVRGLFSER